MSYIDADQGGDLADRKSVFCHYKLLNGNPIFWSFEKKTMIYRSTADKKSSITNGISDVMWVVSLLYELGVKLSSIWIV